MKYIISEKVYENQEQNNTICGFSKNSVSKKQCQGRASIKQRHQSRQSCWNYLIGSVFRHTSIYPDTKYRIEPNHPKVSNNTISRFLSSTLYVRADTTRYIDGRKTQYFSRCRKQDRWDHRLSCSWIFDCQSVVFVGNKWSTKLRQTTFFDQRIIKNNRRNPHYNTTCLMLPQFAKR